LIFIRLIFVRSVMLYILWSKIFLRLILKGNLDMEEQRCQANHTLIFRSLLEIYYIYCHRLCRICIL